VAAWGRQSAAIFSQSIENFRQSELLILKNFNFVSKFHTNGGLSALNFVFLEENIWKKNFIQDKI